MSNQPISTNSVVNTDESQSTSTQQQQQDEEMPPFQYQTDIAETTPRETTQARSSTPLQAAVNSQPTPRNASNVQSSATMATQPAPLIVTSTTAGTSADSIGNNIAATTTIDTTAASQQQVSSNTSKKTLIETRRAEQNRAAQRAFRQRKERYVKELEAKVNMMAEWQTRMEHLEQENQQLKRRIEELESKQQHPQQRHDDDNENMTRRTAIKFQYNDTPYTSSQQQSIKNDEQNNINNVSTVKPQEQQQLSTTSSTTGTTAASLVRTATAAAAGTAGVPVGEKGKVLDDLVSILRTRHRPPIPSHPPN
ncbi:hypothetical protein BDF20DRAFT_368094 [Mycotypha africana]|uniref:uncharacterized protein n=1 Tax=Mycotypha africana TaxID=64632 RepID=UPI0023018841|nr:uncharacterized protein BDF20DRAFT_368094 [Mycotypha africana]KAI8984138.1 hypothetical protein BDF20DRAFT_368094 [Mycotypha africana]